jgi:hypothetical protein
MYEVLLKVTNKFSFVWQAIHYFMFKIIFLLQKSRNMKAYGIIYDHWCIVLNSIFGKYSD